MHVGRNIARIREYRNIKQQTLAEALRVTQANISRIEQSDKISQKLLERVAAALGVTPKVILSFDEGWLLKAANGGQSELDFLPEPELFVETMAVIEMRLCQILEENRAFYAVSNLTNRKIEAIEKMLKTLQESQDLDRTSLT